MSGYTLRSALLVIDGLGFGEDVDADEVVYEAARGLLRIYDTHRLNEVSDSSAADQCESLYEVLCDVGLEVP